VKLREFQKKVYDDAKEKGLWDTLTVIGGLHRVLAEVNEAIDEYEDEDRNWYNFRLELADIVLMTMSVAERTSINLESAMIEKYKINLKREYRHGKR